MYRNKIFALILSAVVILSSCQGSNTNTDTDTAVSGDHEHTMTVKTHTPTCTENGYTEHICTVCDYSFTDSLVKATGHTFDDGVCSVCGFFERAVYIDGVKASSYPEKGNYVVYARGSDTDSFCFWDYDNWEIKNDMSAVTVYFYSVKNLYSSFIALKNDASALSVGDIVGTTSHHDGFGCGAAILEITSGYVNCSSVQIADGKHATLIPFTVGNEKVITVDQFGTKANGVMADQVAINTAFAFSNATTVEFESVKYTQKARLSISNVHNKTINGRGAAISNDYETGVVNWQDFVINDNSTNVTIKNLIISCDETEGQGTLFRNNDHVQLYIGNASFITLDNVTIRTPDNTENDRHVTAVWMQEGAHDVVIKNSTILNLSQSTVGGGIWISNCYNVQLINNHIEKVSHDEILALFNGSVDNVLIENNYIHTHDEPFDNASAHVIGFGVNIESERAYTYTNVIFRNNTLDIVAWKDAFMFGNVDGIEIYGNKVDLRSNTPTQPILNAVFRVPDTTTTQANVSVYDNEITVYNSYEIPFTESCNDGFTFENNKLTFVIN